MNDTTENTTPQTSNDPLSPLTPREREIALMIARGDTNQEIAKALGISVKTYDTHRGHVLEKLQLRHNVDVAKLCIRAGLVLS